MDLDINRPVDILYFEFIDRVIYDDALFIAASRELSIDDANLAMP
jgi:hypothetical protein